MILIGYRHGLRASELCDLQWSQVELATGRLHVRRANRTIQVCPKDLRATLRQVGCQHLIEPLRECWRQQRAPYALRHFALYPRRAR
jgi:integrase